MGSVAVLVGFLLVIVIMISPVLTLVLLRKITAQQNRTHAILQKIQYAILRDQEPEMPDPQAAAVSTAAGPPPEPVRPQQEQAKAAQLTAPPVVPPPLPPAPPPPFAAVRTPVHQTYATPKPEPTQLETVARQILRKIWNWIIVGDEYRDPNVSMEYAVATNWLVRTGVLIVIVGVGFFLDYTSSRGWLGPMGKVSIGFMAGALLVAGGIRILGKRYHLLGQGLIGAGLAVWYAAIFTAFNRYNLIGAGAAFSLMALVTIGAGSMSIRFNSMLMAILGIIGGYGTPIMLSTGTTNFVGLFSYMLLLGIGVLLIASYRNWHLLNAMAFAATWLLAGIALQSGYTTALYWETIPFLTAFFVLFSTVIYIYPIKNGTKATLIELLMLLLNAAVFFSIVYHLTQITYDRTWTAIPALALAAFYTLHLVTFLRKQTQDRALALCFTALAAFFLIITLPILISGSLLTLSWSMQALILLWLGIRLRSRFLHWIAYAQYGVVAARFLLLDLNTAFGTPLLPDLTTGAYLLVLLERATTFGIPALAFALAMRLLNKDTENTGKLQVMPTNDVPPITLESSIPTILGTLLFAIVFSYLHLEINRSLLFAWSPLRMPMLTVLWTAACLVLLRLFIKLRHPALLVCLLAGCTITLIKLFAFDLPVWGFSSTLYRYTATYSFLQAGLRLIDYGVILGFLVYGFNLLKRQPATALLSSAFGYCALTLFCVYTTFEINSFFAHYVPSFRAGAISVYWALYALAIIIGGITRNVRPLRLTGLALFAVVFLKIFLSDMARLSAIYKIVAFILLGILLLAGAYIYLRFQDKFIQSSGEKETPHA